MLVSIQVVHCTCLQLLALCWGGVHQFVGLSLPATVMSSERPPSWDSHATSSRATDIIPVTKRLGLMNSLPNVLRQYGTGSVAPSPCRGGLAPVSTDSTHEP